MATQYKNIITLGKVVRGHFPEPVEKPKKGVPECHKVKGKLSEQSKKRIKAIVRAWATAISLSGVDRNFVFITLTLPSEQIHTDEQIKQKILNPTLQSLRAALGELLYLWVAEKQGNGNIHFHIIVDRFVPIDLLRRCWHQCLDRYGYMERFMAKHPDKNAPTTDIQKVENLEGVLKYVVDYLFKGNDIREVEEIKEIVPETLFNERQSDVKLEGTYTPSTILTLKTVKEIKNDISGKIWGCSHALSQLAQAKAVVINKVLEVANMRDYEIFDNFVVQWKVFVTPSDTDIRKICMELWLQFGSELRKIWKQYVYVQSNAPPIDKKE